MASLKTYGLGVLQRAVVLGGVILLFIGLFGWMNESSVSSFYLMSLGSAILVAEVVREDAIKLGVRKGQFTGMMDIGPWGWFFVCAVFTLPAIVLYLYQRPKYVSAQADSDTVECPYCKEPIKAQAIKCRWCGSELAPAEKPLA